MLFCLINGGATFLLFYCSIRLVKCCYNQKAIRSRVRTKNEFLFSNLCYHWKASRLNALSKPFAEEIASSIYHSQTIPTVNQGLKGPEIPSLELGYSFRILAMARIEFQTRFAFYKFLIYFKES